jgi:hypothetical protein
MRYEMTPDHASTTRYDHLRHVSSLSRRNSSLPELPIDTPLGGKTPFKCRNPIPTKSGCMLTKVSLELLPGLHTIVYRETEGAI